MATGGFPCARMVVILVLLAVPAAIVSFDQTAAAQDASGAALLKKGLEELRAGNYNAGIATLREALAAEPSSEEIMSALGRAEYEALLSLLASGDEGQNVVKALLDRAMPVLPEKAFDEAELRRLVQTAVTAEEHTDRFEAAVTLSRAYGEFAVPGLVAFLASSNTEHRVNAHITLMRRIGRDGVLPLVEALASPNADVRRLVAAELGAIGDERGVPALAEAAANDGDDAVRAEADKALQAMASKFPEALGMAPSDLYMRLAKLYYTGDYRILAYADRPLVTWRWEGDALAGQPVPRHLYVLKLAEEAAYDALRLDPGNASARSLLARVLASEKLSSDVVGEASDDELSGQYAAGLADAAGTVAGLGWDTLSMAVSDGLDEMDHAPVSFVLGVLPWVYGSSDFTTDSPVVRATGDASANVRLAAAASILRFNGMQRITAFPDPDGFLSLVATAVGEVIPRQILVVDGKDDRRNKMLTALNEAKYVAFDARTGSDGIVRALRFSGLDLVILSCDLVDMEALAVVARLQEEERTRNIPIVVVGTSKQAADDTWRNLYQDKVKGLAGVPEGPGLASDEFLQVVADSFEKESPDASARYEKSAMILDALAGTDTANALFNWSMLTETLVGLLTADLPSDPPVRLNAIRALANIGDTSALGALVAFFGGDADDELRAGAGHAIAAICRKGQMGMDDASFATVLKGTHAGSADVRNAAFAALGSAMLTPEQALSVATANRPGVGAAGEGMEEDEGMSDEEDYGEEEE